MDFSLSPQEDNFRKELRDWLDINTKELRQRQSRAEVSSSEGGFPQGESDEYRDFIRWWHKKLYDAGYIGIAWPKEYGGRGATVMEQFIFNEEMAKRRLPSGVGGLGIGWAGPTIIVHGNDSLRKCFLPKILNGEDTWCQAFSEPGLVLTWPVVKRGRSRIVTIMSLTDRKSGQPVEWEEVSKVLNIGSGSSNHTVKGS